MPLPGINLMSKQQKDKEMKVGQIVITTVITVFTVCLLVVSCRQESASTQKKVTESESVPVIVEPVLRNSIVLPIHAPGRLSSSSELKLSFRTGGLIKHFFVNEGSRVKSGKIIAMLDTTETSAYLAKARAGMEKAQRDNERVSALYKDSVAALEMLQNTQTALDAANADLELARSNHDYAVIKAPCAGTVLKNLFEQNEIVGPGMPVVIFGTENNGWIIKCSVSDRDVMLLSTGDSVSCSFDAFQGKFYGAAVTEIAQIADPYTGAFEVEITLRDQIQGLRSGLIASCDIYPVKQQSFTFVPIDALVQVKNDSAVIYAVDYNDRAVMKRVINRGVYGSLAAISGADDGIASVITAGAAYVKDGCRIRRIASK
jgi:multidrug efflux system membrane fusion protein